MKEEKIDKIYYYKFGQADEMWVYATTNNIGGDKIFNYHSLTLIDNIPEIEDIESPLNLLNNISKNPTIIEEGSLDYIRFIALRDIAKKNVLKQIKK